MKPHHALALLAVAAQTGPALAADLTIGSPAPALAVVKWYKGRPVTTFHKGKTYVVEFWATWCGPCKESIPHLTELAKKNTDVTFIGVSIWEDDNGTKIADFVKEMGDKMDYHVGYSSNKGGMAKSWMLAAGQTGIPTSFVVKNGTIEWIGHPMALEKPLAEIKAGTFDRAAFKAKFDKQQEDAREAMAARSALQDCVKLHESGKKDRAQADLEALVAKYPKIAPEADLIRLGWLAVDDPNAWERKAKAMADSKSEDEYMTLDMFAIQQATGPGGSKDLAQKAMSLLLAGPQGKNVLVLYDAGVVFQATKDFRKALDATNAFLVEIKTSQFKDNAELIKGMEKQKADLEAKLKGGGSA